jgi:hypothetical protein
VFGASGVIAGTEHAKDWAMPEQTPRRPTDPRADRRRTERDLVIAGLLLMFVVGGGLIYLLFGEPAFLGALPCFGGVVLLGGLLWGILKLIEWAGQRDS